MVTRSEASDLAVDELKRRARRRLIGAIVLALAAAVLLPLLLESEPKPLGDEVSIQIPPVDSGKFVNPLSPAKAPDGKGGASKSPSPIGAAAPASPPPSAAAPSPAPVLAEAKSGEAAGTAAPSATPAASPTPIAAPPPPAKDETPKEASPAATPAKDAPSTAAKSAPPAEAAPAAGAFVVQVAAFTDRYGALAVARKLKQAGFPAFEESASGTKGELHRVRVGPYPTREAADAAKAKLKAAGYNGIVARR